MKLAQEEKTEFDISDRSIRTVVKQLRPELNQSKLDSLPRLHPAGEAQVGFGTTLFLQGRHLLWRQAPGPYTTPFWRQVCPAFSRERPLNVRLKALSTALTRWVLFRRSFHWTICPPLARQSCPLVREMSRSGSQGCSAILVSTAISVTLSPDTRKAQERTIWATAIKTSFFWYPSSMIWKSTTSSRRAKRRNQNTEFYFSGLQPASTENCVWEYTNSTWLHTDSSSSAQSTIWRGGIADRNSSSAWAKNQLVIRRRAAACPCSKGLSH